MIDGRTNEIFIYWILKQQTYKICYFKISTKLFFHALWIVKFVKKLTAARKNIGIFNSFCQLSTIEK